VTDTNLVRFRMAVAGALAHLESRREEVNELNVFPVADGDTGDNMALTLRAVLDELDRLQGANEERTIDEIGREEIVQSVARAALLGARGNSGVILSQLIRGAAEELISRPGQLIDATLIGAALANAADRAYSSVRDPAEGTMLTVAREMAHKIVTDVAHSPQDSRLGPGTDPGEQDGVIATALERAVAVGQDSVKRGPELLAPLRQAGVVDAGGYGLTIIFAGVVAVLRGDEPPALDHHAPARISHPEHASSTYRFCTNFAVTGSGLSPGRFIDPLERIGDSVLVVGDETTLKVHVHTDEPELATAVFSGEGEVSRLDVADMRQQLAQREARLAQALGGPGVDGRAPEGDGERSGADARAGDPVANGSAAASLNGAERSTGDEREVTGQPGASPGGARDEQAVRYRCGAVAVVSGDGLAEMFHELGVHTIDGGATLNPSTYDLLAGIHEVPAEEVLVLPNSPNVIMAAETAAKLSEKQVLVVPATSQQAGLAAALALAPDRTLEENGQALGQALQGVRTGAVAPAARDDSRGRFKRGEAVGFIGDQVFAWGDPAETLRAVLDALCDGTEDPAGEPGDSAMLAGGSRANAVLAGPRTRAPELISVLAGADAPLGLGEVEQIAEGRIELELRHGGQPAYWWLLAAE
jgi:DAK2 domain fusion protein YloV